MKKIECCSTCGAKMMKRKQSLSRQLCKVLSQFYGQAGRKPMNLNKMTLNYVERVSFQKLRYWRLVDKFITDENKHIGGWWQITERGIAFVMGRTRIPKSVMTYRNEIDSVSEKLVLINEVWEGWKILEDYRREAVGVHEGDQLTFADQQH